MDRQELLSKICALPLAASFLAEDLRAGSFRSLFKGRGIEFDEVRRYEQGDDVRAIDRNVSARFGSPYVKLFREEREMPVFIILDCSASMFTPSGAPDGVSRYEQALLAAALIAFSAEKAGLSAGALLFDRDAGRFFPPERGRRGILAMVNAALDARPRESGSGLAGALVRAAALLKRRGLVAVISDFYCAGWERGMRRLAGRHETAAIAVTDPLEREFPPSGLLVMEDPETGVSFLAPTNFASFRRSWAAWQSARRSRTAAICRRSGAAFTELFTTDDAFAALKRLFKGRK
jgi:uncharacterized protein (DUF58 family)